MLPSRHGHDGANNRPADAADAHHHGDTSPMRGHRDRADTAAPSTAATASPNTVPAAAGGTGSTPMSTSNTVNQARSASARPANLRNQSRTVSTGRPNRAAIVRAPAPAAFADKAAPITSTRSARRNNTNTGSSTCDTAQPEHRARRGRSTTDPTAPRSTRLRAHPHGPNEPAQPGHANPPDTNRVSTSAEFAPTVSTAPPCATRPSRGNSAKRSPGGPSHARHRHGAAPNETPRPRRHTQDPSRTECRINAAPVSTLRDAGQSGPDAALVVHPADAATTGRWVLPLRPTDPNGPMRTLHEAASGGCRWLVVDLTGDAPRLRVRRSREDPAGPGAAWVAAQVQIAGLMGPYVAQVADGYTWRGFAVPRFTRDVVAAIIADNHTLAAGCPPGTLEHIRRRGDLVEIVGAPGTPSERVEVVAPDADGRYRIGAYRWYWETTDPTGYPATTPTARQPATRPRCRCPRRCASCREPVGGWHDQDCPWQRGSARHEHPTIAGEPRVGDRHIHQPGCRHTTQRPGGLFEPAGDDGDVRCLVCAAVNSHDSTVIDPSYGGTTEYHDRCTACGATWGFCDMSAVI